MEAEEFLQKPYWLAQKMHAKHESKIIEFHINEINKIENMDDVPSTFEVPSNRILDSKRATIVTKTMPGIHGCKNNQTTTNSEDSNKNC